MALEALAKGIDSSWLTRIPTFMDDEGRLPIEHELRLRLEAFDPDAHLEMLRALELPSMERAEMIRTLYANVRMQPSADFLMESRTILLHEESLSRSSGS